MKKIMILSLHLLFTPHFISAAQFPLLAHALCGDYSTIIEAINNQTLVNPNVQVPSDNYNGGRTALHFLATQNCDDQLIETIKALRAIGANPEIKDTAGKTPLDLTQSQAIKDALTSPIQ